MKSAYAYGVSKARFDQYMLAIRERKSTMARRYRLARFVYENQLRDGTFECSVIGDFLKVFERNGEVWTILHPIVLAFCTMEYDEGALSIDLVVVFGFTPTTFKLVLQSLNDFNSLFQEIRAKLPPPVQDAVVPDVEAPILPLTPLNSSNDDSQPDPSGPLPSSGSEPEL